MIDAGTASNTNTMQSRRLNRFLVGAGSSILVLLLMFALYWQGYLSKTGFIIIAIAMPVTAVVFYALIRSGFNLKFSDPSLTIPQVISAMVILLTAMYYTSSAARTIIMPIVLMAFVFGVFRLETRKLVSIALFVIAGYALLIKLLLHFQPNDVDLALEFLRLLVFGPVILWFAFMGGYISRLRKKLSGNLVVMEAMATHDPLTGVYNRRHLSKVLQIEKNRSDRLGETFCVALLDLDFFKAINDTFGHQVGDEVLKACAKCGERYVRPSDCFGRYGGEEFQVILNQTDLTEAKIAVERIRDALNNLRFPHIDPNLKVTISIGLAQYHSIESIDAVEQRADAALYVAKSKGRNRVEAEAGSTEETDAASRASLSMRTAS